MDPIRYSYPEPPLPAELQAEIEASVGRFKEMFPAFLRHAAEDYAPRYRAEITTLIRKAVSHNGYPSRVSYLGQPTSSERAETPIQRETNEAPETTI